MTQIEYIKPSKEVLDSYIAQLHNPGGIKSLHIFLGLEEHQRADLSGVNLKEANLSDANLNGVNLSGADLSRATLSGVDLSRANLSGVDLSGANLSGAILSGAILYGAILSGANLSGATLIEADLIEADLSGAILIRAVLFRAKLSKADLSGANLNEVNLWQANLSWANLNGVILSGANLSQVYLVGANLSGANLSGADLRKATLVGANLVGANLSGAILSWADLEWTVLINAIGITEKEFDGAIHTPEALSTVIANGTIPAETALQASISLSQMAASETNQVTKSTYLDAAKTSLKQLQGFPVDKKPGALKIHDGIMLLYNAIRSNNEGNVIGTVHRDIVNYIGRILVAVVGKDQGKSTATMLQEVRLVNKAMRITVPEKEPAPEQAKAADTTPQEKHAEKHKEPEQVKVMGSNPPAAQPETEKPQKTYAEKHPKKPSVVKLSKWYQRHLQQAFGETVDRVLGNKDKKDKGHVQNTIDRAQGDKDEKDKGPGIG